MKYVDEFRDGGLARALAAASAPRSSPAAATTSWSSAAGTRTPSRATASSRPAAGEREHGARARAARSACCRSGASTARSSSPSSDGVILCTYADTMRVPASGLTPDEGEGRAAPTSGWSIRPPMRCASRATNPAREVVFFAIGFETTTPPTAVAIRQAQALGARELLRVLQPRADAGRDHRHPRVAAGARARHRAARRLHRPGARVDVIGSQPYEFFAEEYAKPVVIAGFEPLDVMQAILMLVRQLNEGRPRSRTSSHARSRARATRRRRRWWPRCSSCAARSSGGASARCPTARCASSREYAALRCRASASASSTARSPTTRPASAERSCAA